MNKYAKGLINLGLLVIPFVFFPGVEQFRAPKEAVALPLSLLIGCIAIYAGCLSKFRNKWILTFVVFSLCCAYFAPQFWQFRLAFFETQDKFRLVLDRDISNFWQWKIICQIFIYFLLLWTVSSLRFRLRELNRLFFVISLAGFGMSIFVLIQALGWDPIFKLDTNNIDLFNLSRPSLGGTIGQSTLVSPFIGMTIPFMVYLRKWFWSLTAVGVLIITDSQVAQGAAIVTTFAWVMIYAEKHRRSIAIGSIGVLLICGSFLLENKEISQKLTQDNGRFGTWKTAIADFQSPPREQFNDQRKFVVTGFGPGTFEYYSSIVKKSRWIILHNEPLETFFNFGLIGAFLFLGIGWSLIKSIYFHLATTYHRGVLITLSMSLLYISITSLGTFPWHIEPMRFYSVVVLGLLLNHQILLEEKLI
jgi:hypothetical protein